MGPSWPVDGQRQDHLPGTILSDAMTSQPMELIRSISSSLEWSWPNYQTVGL